MQQETLVQRDRRVLQVQKDLLVEQEQQGPVAKMDSRAILEQVVNLEQLDLLEIPVPQDLLAALEPLALLVRPEDLALMVNREPMDNQDQLELQEPQALMVVPGKRVHEDNQVPRDQGGKQVQLAAVGQLVLWVELVQQAQLV